MRRAISWMIHQSWRASPGSASAVRPICTCRLVLVTVPSFSGHADAGSTTSAWNAVSVRKRSWTTRCSSIASPARACAVSGSDIAGFSPMMYIPLIFPACTASMISTTVRPFSASSARPHRSSKRARISSASTDW